MFPHIDVRKLFQARLGKMTRTNTRTTGGITDDVSTQTLDTPGAQVLCSTSVRRLYKRIACISPVVAKYGYGIHIISR